MSQYINGQKILSGVFKAGTSSLPGIRFSNSVDDGFYYIGTNNIGLTLNGSKVVDFLTTGVSITGTITGSTLTDGTASLSSGALSGLVSATDGTASWSSSSLSGFTSISGTTITDTVASINAGALSGVTTIGMSGDLTNTGGNLNFTDYAPTIQTTSSAGAGYNINFVAADAFDGDTNGGGFSFDLGQPSGSGSSGVFEVKGDTEPWMYLTSYDGGIGANDTISKFVFRGYDGSNEKDYVVLESILQDDTADHQYTNFSIDLYRDGSEYTALRYQFMTGGPYDYLVNNIGNSDTGTMLTLGGEAEDSDGKAGIIFGVNGGTSTSGAGYDAGGLYLIGGTGSDAFDGDTNGGAGGNVYISAGLGGALSGGGADGADGVVYLGYDGTNITNVSIGNSSTSAGFYYDTTNFISYQNGLSSTKSSELVDDDATIALANVVGPILAWDADGDFVFAMILADGVVSSIQLSANGDVADTNGKLCVFDNGANAVIKNRKGSPKVVTYQKLGQ